jgi:hypothetical protein
MDSTVTFQEEYLVMCPDGAQHRDGQTDRQLQCDFDDIKRNSEDNSFPTSLLHRYIVRA